MNTGGTHPVWFCLREGQKLANLDSVVQGYIDCVTFGLVQEAGNDQGNQLGRPEFYFLIAVLQRPPVVNEDITAQWLRGFPWLWPLLTRASLFWWPSKHLWASALLWTTAAVTVERGSVPVSILTPTSRLCSQIQRLAWQCWKGLPLELITQAHPQMLLKIQSPASSPQKQSRTGGKWVRCTRCKM